MDLAAITYPIHGQYKLSNEGYRTRDGHIIEWLGRFSAAAGESIGVVSRPEPALVAPLRRLKGQVAPGTVPIQTLSLRMPNLFSPKDWWVQSAGSYPNVSSLSNEAPALIWNMFAASAPSQRNPFTGRSSVVFDLLDDWTIHHAFRSIRSEAEMAYRRAFEFSCCIFANSEATLELAHRFGRTDAQLLTNGVDPERFSAPPNATGPLTVGYVGKIGKRLDPQLISDVCSAFPKIRFVFAGPFLDAHDRYRKLLSGFSNIELRGDVHYDDVPSLMAEFDLGWVPHAVGDNEVGGDVIKTYEYRASGLQVLTTPILGAGRTLTEGVHIVSAVDQVEWLREAIHGRERLERVVADIPDDLTWRYKAGRIANALGIAVEADEA
jgi:hypothetical protein